jgi:hypothetical protein
MASFYRASTCYDASLDGRGLDNQNIEKVPCK